MSDNLVENANVEVPQGEPQQEASQQQDQPVSQPEGNQEAPATWYFDENLPGTGDKPDWLIDKFKTAADQAKAFVEAEKRLGAFKGAPEEYTLEIDDPELKDVKFDKENPVLQEFLKTAKEQNVSQEFVETLLKTHAKMQKMQMPNFEKEMEKLGVNGKQDLQLLLQWGSNNLTKDELQTFKGMVRTAEDVRVFEKIRRIATRAETQPSNQRTHVESAEKVKRLVHDPRYETDPVFREEVRAKLAQVLPE